MDNNDSKEIYKTINELDNILDDENFIEFYDAEFENMEIISAERTTAFGWIK